MSEKLALENSLRETAHVDRDHDVRSRATKAHGAPARPSPLPVPFSPVIKTLASEGATREISSITGRMPATRQSYSAYCRGAIRSSLRAAGLCAAPAERDLRPHNGEQAIVIPRFRDKIARPELHRFDGEIDRRPSRHDHDRQRVIDRLDARNDFQPFLPGGGIAGVIQIHHQQRVVAFLQRLENAGERRDRVRLIALALQQNAQGFQHVGLVIGD